MRLALFGHSLAQKATLVRIGDTVEENIEELRELEISLHGKTMQLQAVMNGQTLLSLIDSGSTHNFISVTVAQRLAIPVTPSVSIANGEKVKSRGICSRLLFYIATHEFFAGFYILPLIGSDIVLGIKWLPTFGLWCTFAVKRR